MRTQTVPFQLKTDIRGARKSIGPQVKVETFKAREMPNYKFFEPKPQPHEPIKFA